MEELTQTANAQLATFVTSLIVLDAVERLGLLPGACAGHSLGEYTALWRRVHSPWLMDPSRDRAWQRHAGGGR